MADSDQIIPVELIERRIYMIRGQKVMLDSDLAELYGVETKVLNQAVSRNKDRFPERYAFRLSKDEFENLRSQIVTSSWGGRRYPPLAFTEHGVAMLSSVLKSKQAIRVSISIIDTFVRMREILATHKELADKLIEHDGQIAYLFEQVERLMFQAEKPKNPIGFIPDKDKS